MTTVNLRGWIDGCADGSIHGWANAGQKRSMASAVDVLIDGDVVDTVVADQYRPDLEKAGIREGRAAFDYQIPDGFRDGESHLLEIRHHETGQPLENSPKTFCLARRPIPTALRRPARDPSGFVLRDGSRTDGFEEALRTTRKVAIISTYHDAGSFLGYHEALFRALSENDFLTIVVHASSRATQLVAAPRTAGVHVIVKRNVGYDFGSWAVAVDRLGPLLGQIDELILLNDSVIPLDGQSFGSLLRRARASGADVVGLTESYEHIYHLQSYFIWLGTSALRSATFRDFMTSYSFSSVKEVVIEEGELALTKRFMDAGFSVQALFEYEEAATLWLQSVSQVIAEIEDLPAAATNAQGEDYRRSLVRQIERVTGNLVDGRPMNPTHFFWDTLIERCRFPFLKRELALMNPCNVPTYFRIGRVLHTRTEARKAVRELRRVYGGNLLPTFVPQTLTRFPLHSVMSGVPGQPAHLAVIG